MSTRVLIRRAEDGRLRGVTEADEALWGRFRRALESMEFGDVAQIEFHDPRRTPMHKQYMRMLRGVFDHQDRFADFEQFREYVEMGAGHVEYVMTPYGLQAKKSSVSFAQLDEGRLLLLFRRIIEFVYSEHCRAFLWPHLPIDDPRSYGMAEALVGEFER
jgi:hypothetical protein